MESAADVIRETAGLIVAFTALVAAVGAIVKVLYDARIQKRANADLRARMAKQDLENAQMHKDIDGFVTLLGESNAHISRLQVAYDLLSAKYSTLQAQYETLKAKYDAMKTENEILRRKVNGVEKKQTGELTEDK